MALGSLLFGLVLSLILFARLKTGGRENNKRRSNKAVFSLFFFFLFLLTLGVSYGALKERVCPNASPFPLSAAVTLKARVSQIQQISGGTKIVLAVYGIGDIPLTRCESVDFSVEWMQWNAEPSVQVGDDLQFSGELARPPEKSASGTPVREELARQGIYYELADSPVNVQIHRPGWVHNAVYGWQQSVLQRISTALGAMDISEENQSLFESIAFGRQNDALPQAIQSNFLQSGLLHVLAASGSNVFLMEWCFQMILWPVRRLRPVLRFPGILLDLAQIVFIWGFCGLCGFQASIVRATLMSNYRTVGRVSGRNVSVWNGLLFAALLMSLVKPDILESTSAVLSFIATAAVQQGMQIKFWNTAFKAGTNRKILFLRNFAGKCLTTLQIAFTVELYLLPLTIFFFQQITPLSVIANVLAEPIVFLLLPVTVVSVILALGYQWLPELFPFVLCKGSLWVGTALLKTLLCVTRWVGSSDISLYQTQKVSFFDVLSYYFLIIGGYAVAKLILNKKKV